MPGVLPPPCRAALVSYRRPRGGLDATSRLLASRQGRLSRQRALESSDRCCELTGIPRVTRNLLSHSCAGRWMSSGVPLGSNVKPLDIAVLDWYGEHLRGNEGLVAAGRGKWVGEWVEQPAEWGRRPVTPHPGWRRRT